jgi:hypothetical protein
MIHMQERGAVTHKGEYCTCCNDTPALNKHPPAVRANCYSQRADCALARLLAESRLRPVKGAGVGTNTVSVVRTLQMHHPSQTPNPNHKQRHPTSPAVCTLSRCRHERNERCEHTPGPALPSGPIPPLNTNGIHSPESRLRPAQVLA